MLVAKEIEDRSEMNKLHLTHFFGNVNKILPIDIQINTSSANNNSYVFQEEKKKELSVIFVM